MGGRGLGLFGLKEMRAWAKKSKGFWWLFLLLLGVLAYRFSPLLTGAAPPPHGPQGPFPVDVVRAAPMPAVEARRAHLDGVLVRLEGFLEKKRETRGGTLLLWIGGFKVVAYPYLARDLDSESLRMGTRVKVVGVLRDHPRYGWEVILRRPSDLGLAPPAS